MKKLEPECEYETDLDHINNGKKVLDIDLYHAVEFFVQENPVLFVENLDCKSLWELCCVSKWPVHFLVKWGFLLHKHKLRDANETSTVLDVYLFLDSILTIERESTQNV